MTRKRPISGPRHVSQVYERGTFFQLKVYERGPISVKNGI